MAKLDAILVPGGGVRADGRLPPWVERRLDRVLALHTSEHIITLSAGTVYKPPPIDKFGAPVFESIAGARYLIERGVPPSLVLAETCSYDTIGNAYFSRAIHVDPRGFRALLVVTSAFHMPRTEAIFRWVYGLSPRRCTLQFEWVPDAGMAPAALSARRQLEAARLRSLVPVMSRIDTIDELHRWLFTDHRAYAVDKLDRRPEVGDAIDTY